ncbi:MAG: hypothetical protein Q8Q35_01460 [Nanoarchaeota archaeon]|nr:hypothetical protein [Nanoarchaeota archaeon]
MLNNSVLLTKDFNSVADSLLNRVEDQDLIFDSEGNIGSEQLMNELDASLISVEEYMSDGKVYGYVENSDTSIVNLGKFELKCFLGFPVDKYFLFELDSLDDPTLPYVIAHEGIHSNNSSCRIFRKQHSDSLIALMELEGGLGISSTFAEQVIEDQDVGYETGLFLKPISFYYSGSVGELEEDTSCDSFIDDILRRKVVDYSRHFPHLEEVYSLSEEDIVDSFYENRSSICSLLGLF